MAKLKFLTINIIVLLLFSYSVFAINTDFDFYRDDGTAGTTFDAGYQGDIRNMNNWVVRNKNFACEIKCRFTTNQGKSGVVPGTSNGIIRAGGWWKSPLFSIPVVAQGSKVIITMTCEDVGSWPCENSKIIRKDVSIKFASCGDGIKQSAENCDGGSKICSQLESKYYLTKSASCKSDCSGYNTNVCEYCNDGIKNGPEACDSGNRNGVKCSPSCGSSCSYCDSSCRIQTIKGDCKDTEQCSNSGRCINVVNDDNNCGAIGNKCDVTHVETPVGSECSVDNKKAIQKIKETWYSCEYKTCKKQEKIKKEETPCGDLYCQDGQCGCSEGYGVCEPLKKCVKKKAVKLNQPCKCDFQCEEGFCDETLCVKGLNVKLSSSKTNLNVGDEATVSLSVSNPLNQDIKTDITLSLGDGVEIIEVLSGDQFSGNQCKLDKTNIPAGGKKDVTVKVKATSQTTSLMSGHVEYQFGSKKIPVKEEISIKITECGDGIKEEGETSQTCCIDAGCPSDNFFYSFSCDKKTKSCDKNIHSYFIYGGIGALILVLLIIFGIGRAVSHKKSVSEKKRKQREEQKKEAKKQKEKLGEKSAKGTSNRVAKEIEHLHALMEKGILTKREFKKKKKRLLKKET